MMADPDQKKPEERYPPITRVVPTTNVRYSVYSGVVIDTTISQPSERASRN